MEQVPFEEQIDPVIAPRRGYIDYMQQVLCTVSHYAKSLKQQTLP